jgi:hypothetical protein
MPSDTLINNLMIILTKKVNIKLIFNVYLLHVLLWIFLSVVWLTLNMSVLLENFFFRIIIRLYNRSHFRTFNEKKKTFYTGFSLKRRKNDTSKLSDTGAATPIKHHQRTLEAFRKTKYTSEIPDINKSVFNIAMLGATFQCSSSAANLRRSAVVTWGGDDLEMRLDFRLEWQQKVYDQKTQPRAERGAIPNIKHQNRNYWFLQAQKWMISKKQTLYTETIHGRNYSLGRTHHR